MKLIRVILIFSILFHINSLNANSENNGVIGISYDVVDKKIQISNVHTKSPAYNAGLQYGDIVTKINNQSFDQFTKIQDFAKLFSGKSNTDLSLEILRGSKKLNFSITRLSRSEVFNCKIKELSESELYEFALFYYNNFDDKSFFDCTLIGHKKGFVSHTYNLGFAYEDGIHIAQNINKAISLYEEIEDFYPAAVTQLGYIYDIGKNGIEVDPVKAKKYYEKGVDQNEVWAMYNLALFYTQNIHTTPNYKEAERLYLLAADMNHALSMNNLGYMYEYGEGVDVDLEKSFLYYKKAADLGEVLAINNLGMCYRDGNCAPEKNIEKAIELFTKAAEQYGDPSGYFNIAQVYTFTDEPLYNDINKELEFYKLAAEKGNREAQYELGYIYDYGEEGVEQNTKLAIKYYEMAAAQQDASAYHALGYLFENLSGDKKINTKRAIEYYEKGAELGHANSYYNLSYIYSNGLNVKVDNHKAVKILKNCINQINAPICLDGLSYYYAEGKGGVRQSDKEAVRYLQLAIDQDYTRSYGALAWYYQNGAGVEKNSKEAFRLFKIGADRDDPYSQSNLGWHYEFGEGTRIDLKKAYFYYSKAAENGNDFGSESLKKLLEKNPSLKEPLQLEVKNDEKIESKEIEITELKNEVKKKKNIVKSVQTNTKNQISLEEDAKIKLIPVESEFLVIKKTTVRIKPDSDSPRVKLVAKGDILYIPGKHESSEWYAVENESGVKIGYIFANAIKALDQGTTITSTKPYDIKWGNYYALVIANEDYKNLDKLSTPKLDAEILANTLEKKYNFNTEILVNVTRDDILDKFYEYRSKLKPNDNLLIYYAGHGDEDSITKEGYWQPIGAKPNRPSSWISNSEILTGIRGLRAKHIIVIVDSCFSGAILRTRGEGDEEIIPKDKLELEKFYKKKNNKVARVAITSGNLEPVPDSLGNSQHSPFAKSLIDILEDNEEIMLSSGLFVKLETYLTKYSNYQETLYSPLNIPEHKYGGHFIFVPNQ